MGEVKRYDLDQREEEWATMQPDSQGDYVTWEDYCRLLKENAELVEALRLAANRLDRLTLEVSGGYWRSCAAEWTGEARAALAKHRGE